MKARYSAFIIIIVILLLLLAKRKYITVRSSPDISINSPINKYNVSGINPSSNPLKFRKNRWAGDLLCGCENRGSNNDFVKRLVAGTVYNPSPFKPVPIIPPYKSRLVVGHGT